MSNGGRGQALVRDRQIKRTHEVAGYSGQGSKFQSEKESTGGSRDAQGKAAKCKLKTKRGQEAGDKLAIACNDT